MGLASRSRSRPLPGKKVTLRDLPEDILLEVLSRVPRRDLVLNCRLVCSWWRDLVDLPVLWNRKCRRYGYHPERSGGRVQDWRTFYFQRCERNLVKNPCGEEGLDFWDLDEIQWTTAQDIVGKDLRRFYESCKNLPRPLPEVQKCFTLTYEPGLYSQFGTKTQRITLKDEGYPDHLMDETRPSIVVKDWFYTPFLAHCQLCVKLLSAEFEVLQECCLTSNYEEWNEVSYVFHNYPPGVRHIELEHKAEYRFGGKVTHTSITIDPEGTGGPSGRL